ncbi:MAG TPA: hypothetical protein DIU07_20320 [Rhodobacteraceae bacterium]|nr:hypothetical protein [Paracoccaceae bacterium]
MRASRNIAHHVAKHRSRTWAGAGISAWAGVRSLVLASLVLAVAWTFAAVTPAHAAEREVYRAFLETTGFDVAITSLQQDAMSGPGMSGQEANDFGNQYVALAEQVFDPDLMLDRAIDMMTAVMPDELVAHGAEFYASALGQRLVEVENASHMTGLDDRRAQGEAIVTELAGTNPERLEDFQAMMDAIGGVDASVRAILEVQIRYLLAAMAAGTVDFEFSEAELRAIMAEQEPMMKTEIARNSIIGAAYTYRDVSDEDIRAYRTALETPMMQQVYEALNAIQYQVMAERYEVLAGKLAGLAPQTDL